MAPPASAFRPCLTRIAVGRDVVPLWQVENLEAHVDRVALLRAVDPPEPPYWAHLWSGARLLAAAVPHAAGRVLELGCGLGLPGLVAARRGATVVATDREVAPLAFVRASARAAGLDSLRVLATDFRDVAVRACFDLVLLAEVLYDREAFGPLVATLDRVLTRDGVALLVDARRIDTTAFYTLLERARFAWSGTEFTATEEGAPVRLRLARVRRCGR